MIIPYRFENGKCFIRRLKSSEKASVNEVSPPKKEETVDIKKRRPRKNVFFYRPKTTIRRNLAIFLSISMWNRLISSFRPKCCR